MKKDDDLLLGLVRDGASDREIARRLKRTVASTKARKRKLERGVLPIVLQVASQCGSSVVNATDERAEMLRVNHGD